MWTGAIFLGLGRSKDLPLHWSSDIVHDSLPIVHGKIAYACMHPSIVHDFGICLSKNWSLIINEILILLQTRTMSL